MARSLPLLPTCTALTLCAALAAGAVRNSAVRNSAVDFDRDVRPILAANCFACHGPDEAAREADLRLDLRAGVLTVAAPGDAEASELWRRITHADAGERMPPAETGKALSAAEVATLRAWIDEGVGWAGHWAFDPPAPTTPPPVSDEAWVRDPLDRFVLARLDELGERPSPEAAREKLLRRVSFDLTGLPPTLTQLDSFLRDESPEAYERVVDRLLASPRHGEHMAAWWLDGARYADTNGYQNDFARAQWPWRDWVIEAFNANMPYDQFLTQQLAGDLLPDATLAQRIATGFNRNHRMVTEAGSIDEEWRVENVADRVETTSTMFLGLTMGCARCHDHKYDPITQRDYYRFYAYFNNVDEQGVYTETRGNVAPLVQVPRAEDAASLAELDRRRTLAEVEVQRRAAQATASVPQWEAELRSSASDDLLAAAIPATLHVRSNEAGAASSLRSVAPHVALAGEPESFLDLGQAVLFDQDRPFTIAFWIKADSDGALVSKMADDDTYRGFDIVMQANGRLISHLIHDWPENGIKVETDEALELGRWTHVAYTYDGSRKAAGVHLFFDGRDVALTTHSDTLDGTLRTQTPLRLGRRHYTNDFGGALADVSFFSGELDAPARDGVRRQRLFELLELATDDAAQAELAELLLSSNADEWVEARAERDAIEREREALEASVPTSMVMAEREDRRPTYLLRRGRYDAPAEEELEPGLPGFLGVAEQPRDRLQLARWMTSTENPLGARVIVNQIWQGLFGVGLLETSENFGIQGRRPSHPELLDWLAMELVQDGWDLAALQKRIVMSATYRQSSGASGAGFAADPSNLRLSRGPRLRLSAEQIRDQALAVSGLLVERIGGPPTRPYQPAGLWKELAGGAGQGPYVQDAGDGLYRRSLYTHRKRTVPHPSLSNFDAPGFDVCVARRTRTNTPLQALALLNDVTYVEAARGLARRMLREAGPSPRERIVFGFRLTTSRTPSEREVGRLFAGWEKRLAEYSSAPATAEKLLEVGNSPADPSLAPAELAAYTLTAAVLLNLDETITKE